MRADRIALALLFVALATALPVAGQPYCSEPVPDRGEGTPRQSPHPQCSQCQGASCTGSPCYAGSGVYTARATDLSVSGTGLALGVSRTYLSSKVSDGAVGIGWWSNLTARVQVGSYLWAAPDVTRTLATVLLADGNRRVFKREADGAWTAPEGSRDALVSLGDGSLEFRPAWTTDTYRFGPTGRLEFVRDEQGHQRTYTYGTGERLDRVTDETTGVYLELTWGADGRIASISDSRGRQIAYTYNGDGTLKTASDPAPRLTRYSYTAGRFGPVLTRIADHWDRTLSTIAYDGKGRTASFTENGETYTYTYDSPTQTTKRDSAGNAWVYGIGSGGWLITARKQPTAVGGASTTATYNDDGTTQTTLDETGVQTAYTYDGQGKVATVTKAAGTPETVRWDYAYDAAFPEKVAAVTPKRPSDQAQLTTWQAWQYEYWPTGSPSPGSLKTVKRVRTDGAAEVTATYEYDTQGRVTRQTAGVAQTDYAYDGQGNLQSVTAPANADAGARPATTYGYDSLGRVQTVTDPQGHVTSYTYDALGRVLTVTLPKPSVSSPLTFTTTYTYDNWDAATGLLFTHVTDPNGRLTKLGYDQHGRLAKSIDAASGATTYAYTRDVLTSITDANGNVTGYEYDAIRRLTKTTFPDGATETYTYRADGLLSTKTDRRGVTVTYTYDPLKRLTQKAYSSGGSITYTYTGQLLSQVLDTTTTPQETHTFTYDPSYRLGSVTQGPRGTVTYTYGAGDRLEGLDLPGGVSADYGYYPDGSLKTIDWSPVAGTFRWDYTATGQYQQVSFPSGQSRSYAYDDQGRLLQLTSALGATPLASVGYSYDVDHATGTTTMLGQRTGQTTTLPAQALSGALAKYQYDGLYELKKAEYPAAAPFNGAVESWTYDAIGNRLTATTGTTTRSYGYYRNGANPQNGQRLQSDGDATWGYDAAGNATSRQGSDGSFAFAYDPENRMNGISGATSASYTYDYQGRRTSRTVNGVTTTWLYDGLNLVAETTNGQTTYFLNGPGIDEPLAMSKAGAVSYFSVDGLGSVLATNDPSGTVTHSVVFDAWGNVKAETGTRAHPFTYTGRETGEAGFHFYRARLYQPSIGRFSQEDPVLRGGIPNAFSYVASNPAMMSDPLGLQACPAPAPAPSGGGPLILLLWALSQKDRTRPPYLRPVPPLAPDEPHCTKCELPPENECEKRFERSREWIQSNVFPDSVAFEMWMFAKDQFTKCMLGEFVVFPGEGPMLVPNAPKPPMPKPGA